jgi:hypothetical protein
MQVLVPAPASAVPAFAVPVVSLVAAPVPAPDRRR